MPNNNDQESDFELVDNSIEDDTLPSAGVRFMAKGSAGRLTGTDIQNYSKVLDKKNFEYNTMLSLIDGPGSYKQYQGSAPTLEAVQASVKNFASDVNSPDIMFIPTALKASQWNPFAEDHVTLLIINKKTNSIEYYDPKGGDLSAEKRTLVALPGVTGKDLLKSITPSIMLNNLPAYAYEYQSYKPQGFWAKVLAVIGLGGLGRRLSSHQGAFNRVDCGIFVCRAMNEYLNGGFEQMTQTLPKGFNMQTTRREMGACIKNQPSADAEAPQKAHPVSPSLLHRSSSAPAFSVVEATPKQLHRSFSASSLKPGSTSH